jgi:phosphatidylserine/phosphatidylglycerophosphate/cardiolipin synthase-like enzyme
MNAFKVKFLQHKKKDDGFWNAHVSYDYRINHQRFEWVITVRASEVKILIERCQRQKPDAFGSIMQDISNLSNLHEVTMFKLWKSHSFYSRRGEEIGRAISMIANLEPLYNSVADVKLLLNISALSFDVELGRKGLEGWLHVHQSGFLAPGLNPRMNAWTWQWVVLKDTNVLTFDTPYSTNPKSVTPIDPTLSITLVRRILVIRTSFRRLAMRCITNTQANMWHEHLNAFYAKAPRKLPSNVGFYSTFPTRLGNDVQVYPKTRDYFAALADALLRASHEVYFCSWKLTPDILLTRPPAPPLRLDQLLLFKAIQGVKIYILLYKEIELAAQGNNSAGVKEFLGNLHPNIFVLRHPNKFFGGSTARLWSHHEKMVVVDRRLAFCGGVDCAIGRWEEHKRVVDEEGLTHPSDYRQQAIGLFAALPSHRLDPHLPNRQSRHDSTSRTSSQFETDTRGGGYDAPLAEAAVTIDGVVQVDEHVTAVDVVYDQDDGQQPMYTQPQQPSSPEAQEGDETYNNNFISTVPEAVVASLVSYGTDASGHNNKNNSRAMDLMKETPEERAFRQQLDATVSSSGTSNTSPSAPPEPRVDEHAAATALAFLTVDGDGAYSTYGGQSSGAGTGNQVQESSYRSGNDSSNDSGNNNNKKSSWKSAFAGVGKWVRKRASLLQAWVSDSAPLAAVEPPSMDAMRLRHPRTPWHDITCRVSGPAVVDLLAHFVQRFNHHSIAKGQVDRPLLIESSDCLSAGVCWNCRRTGISCADSICGETEQGCGAALGPPSRFSTPAQIDKWACDSLASFSYIHLSFSLPYFAELRMIGPGPVLIAALDPWWLAFEPATSKYLCPSIQALEGQFSSRILERGMVPLVADVLIEVDGVDVRHFNARQVKKLLNQRRGKGLQEGSRSSSISFSAGSRGSVHDTRYSSARRPSALSSLSNGDQSLGTANGNTNSFLNAIELEGRSLEIVVRRHDLAALLKPADKWGARQPDYPRSAQSQRQRDAEYAAAAHEMRINNAQTGLLGVGMVQTAISVPAPAEMPRVPMKPDPAGVGETASISAFRGPDLVPTFSSDEPISAHSTLPLNVTQTLEDMAPIPEQPKPTHRLSLTIPESPSMPAWMRGGATSPPLPPPPSPLNLTASTVPATVASDTRPSLARPTLPEPPAQAAITANTLGTPTMPTPTPAPPAPAPPAPMPTPLVATQKEGLDTFVAHQGKPVQVVARSTAPEGEGLSSGGKVPVQEIVVFPTAPSAPPALPAPPISHARSNHDHEDREIEEKAVVMAPTPCPAGDLESDSVVGDAETNRVVGGGEVVMGDQRDQHDDGLLDTVAPRNRLSTHGLAAPTGQQSETLAQEVSAKTMVQGVQDSEMDAMYAAALATADVGAKNSVPLDFSDVLAADSFQLVVRCHTSAAAADLRNNNINTHAQGVLGVDGSGSVSNRDLSPVRLLALYAADKLMGGGHQTVNSSSGQEQHGLSLRDSTQVAIDPLRPLASMNYQTVHWNHPAMLAAMAAEFSLRCSLLCEDGHRWQAERDEMEFLPDCLPALPRPGTAGVLPAFSPQILSAAKAYLPPPSLFPPRHPRAVGSCSVKVLRSVGHWSIGHSDNICEDSILKTWQETIRQAERFVYIESQFFIGSTGPGSGEPKNGIPEAILERIIRAARAGQVFRVYVLIPMHPTGDYVHDLRPRIIMHYEYLTICKGRRSLLERFQTACPGVDPTEFICFTSLQNWGKLDDFVVHDQIYVHSKLLIADDRVLVVGSANINDRSMLGARDTEVAVRIEDSQCLEVPLSDLPGQAFLVGGAVHRLRRRLMNAHLASSSQEVANGCGGGELADASGRACWRHLWQAQASINSLAYDWLDGATSPYRTTTLAGAQQALRAAATLSPKRADHPDVRRNLDTIRGHVVNFPLNLLSSDDIGPSAMTRAVVPNMLWV